MTALIFFGQAIVRCFGAELSKDKIVKCININLLKYKLNKTHEGISEHPRPSPEPDKEISTIRLLR